MNRAFDTFGNVSSYNFSDFLRPSPRTEVFLFPFNYGALNPDVFRSAEQSYAAENADGRDRGTFTSNARYVYTYI